MADQMHFAFIDESGTVGVDTGTHFLIIGVICADRVRDIETPVRRAQKKLGTSLASGEMKASSSRESLIMRLLKDLVKEDIQIIAVAVDQKSMIQAPADKEEIYRQAVSRAAYHLVELWPRVQLCLDQRYTNCKLRLELEKQIREEIVDLPQKVVLIQQVNSQTQRGLQAADFIAWAFYQKYENGDCRFVDILAPKIQHEELIVKLDWKKERQNV